MNGSRALPLAFLAALGMVGYDEIVTQGHLPPYPQRFMFVGMVYVMLGFLDAAGLGALAGIFGWGVVLALGYKAVGAHTAAAQTASLTTTGATAATGGAVAAA